MLYIGRVIEVKTVVMGLLRALGLKEPPPRLENDAVAKKFAKECFNVISQRDGITHDELSDVMGRSKNALYAGVRPLLDGGLIRIGRDRKYFLASSEAVNHFRLLALVTLVYLLLPLTELSLPLQRALYVMAMALIFAALKFDTSPKNTVTK